MLGDFIFVGFFQLGYRFETLSIGCQYLSDDMMQMLSENRGGDAVVVWCAIRLCLLLQLVLILVQHPPRRLLRRHESDIVDAGVPALCRAEEGEWGAEGVAQSRDREGGHDEESEG